MASRNTGTRNTGTATQNDILLAIGCRRDTLAWRQQVGVFRAMDNPDRIIKAGVPGMADIGCIVQVIVTPEMVGKTIGVAVQMEAKSGTGRQKDQQKLWELAVHKRSGLYVVTRTPEQAVAAIENLPALIIGRS